MRGVAGAILFFVLIARVIAEEYPGHVQVYRLSTMEIHGVDALGERNVNVDIRNIDSLALWEQQHLPSLPHDATEATKIARQWVQTMQHMDQTPFHAGWRTLLSAARFGINKVPAVVFNHGKAVLFGETDLLRAIRHWQRWKAAQ